MRYSTIFAAALSLTPFIVRSQAQKSSDNVTVQTLALETLNAPWDIMNKTASTFNKTVFIDNAIIAINATLFNLLNENDGNLDVCGGTGDLDQTFYQPNCDQSPNPGDLLAQLVFDFDASDDVVAAVMNNTVFKASLPNALLSFAEELAAKNSTVGVIRVVDSTIGESLFPMSIILVSPANQTTPGTLADVDNEAFYTVNITAIQETAEYLNYAAYLVGTMNATSIPSASASASASVLLSSSDMTSGAISYLAGLSTFNILFTVLATTFAFINISF